MKKLFLEKIIISSSLGSDKERIISCKEHFQNFNKSIKLEEIISKKSVHGWSVRKGHSIGFKSVLRREQALNFLKLLKESDLLSNECKITNGRFIIGIEKCHFLRNIDYSPISPKYGLQVHVCFAFTGSNLNRKMRNKVKRQKKVPEEEVRSSLNEL